MFDFDKVQKDYLTAALKAYKKHMQCNFFTAHDEEKKTTYISDGSFFVIVPDEMCFITSTDTMRHVSPDIFEKMKKDLPGCYDRENEIKDMFITRNVPTDLKRSYHVFGHQSGEEIWIDEKILAYFASMDGLSYFCTGKRAPVAVYMYETLVGVMLPINH